MAHLRWLITAILVLTAAPPLVADGVTGAHVRVHHKGLEPYFEEAIARSLLVRQLVATLDASDVIVYLEFYPLLPPMRPGALVFAASSGGVRYLRVRLSPFNTLGEMIAAIGHELQHAVEVAAEPSVHSARTLAEYYKRIGIKGKGDEWDTHAAREVTALVRRDLAAKPQ